MSALRPLRPTVQWTSASPRGPSWEDDYWAQFDPDPDPLISERDLLRLQRPGDHVIDQFDARERYQTTRNVASALGRDDDGELAPGLLTRAVGALDRPRAEVFNALREVFDGEEGFDYQRWRQRVADREAFRDLDWAKPGEDAGLAERAGFGLARFLGDVALDPLTYFTGGGSVLGRRLGSQAVAAHGRRIAGEALEGVSEEVLRHQARRYSTTELAEQLAGRGLGQADELAARGMDPLLDLARQQNMLGDLAQEGLARGMGQAYATGGSTRLRRFMDDQSSWRRGGEGVGPVAGLPDDVGMDIWRALPAEFKGGVGFRVPMAKFFAQTPEGRRLPVRITLPGTGGGRGLERLGMGWAHDLGNHARTYLRLSPFGRTLNRLSGQSGEMYGQMLTDTSRRLYMGQDEAFGRSFGRFEGLDRSLVKTREWDAAVDETLQQRLSEVEWAWTAGARRHGADADAVRRRFNELANDPEALRAIPAGPSQDPTEELARLAARQMLDAEADLFAQLRSLGLDAGWLNDHAPRMLAKEAQEQAELLARRGRGSGTKYDPTKAREQYVRRWNYDPDTDTLHPTSWQTVEEANRASGKTVFVDDAWDAGVTYLSNVRRLARRERLIKALQENGLATQFRLTTEDYVDVAKVAQMAGRAKTQAEQAAEQMGEASGRQLEDLLRGAGADVPKHASQTWTRQAGGGVVTSADGASLVRGADGTWTATMPDGQALAEAFPSEAAAKKAANAALRDQRKAARIDTLADLRAEQVKRLTEDAEFLATGLEAGTGLRTAVEQQQYFNDLVETAGRHLDGAGFDDVVSQKAVEGYRRWAADRGDVLLSDPNQQRLMAARLDELGLMGPEAVKRAITRMYRAQTGQTEMQAWVQNVWQPLYQAAKAWMTSGRGTGYIARNVVGGMWNAHLYDVRAVHFQRATVLSGLKVRAAQKASSVVGPDALPSALAQQTKSEFDRLVRSTFKDEADSVLATFQAFERNVLGPSSGGARTRGIMQREMGPGGELGELPPEAMTIGDKALSKAVDNPWVRFWSRRADESEEYLRLATFLKGADEFGLADGGYAAGQAVKATQFDYADLDSAERGLKQAWTFYTFSRYSVPLNFRGLLYNPGKVNKLVRSNDELRAMFGDPEAEEEFVQARWTQDRLSWVSRWRTSEGYPIVVGIESPLMDLNKLFLAPDPQEAHDPRRWVNWDEVQSNLNPFLTQAADTVRGVDSFTRGERTSTMEAPGWARFIPGATSVTPDGDRVMRTSTRQAAENLLPPLGMAARLVPGVGNDRQDARRLTSWLSTAAAAPVATIDPWQEASELRRRTTRIDRGLEGEVPNLSMRRDYVNALLNEGLEPDELAARWAPRERDIFDLDQAHAVSTVRAEQFVQRLLAAGFSEDEVEWALFRRFGPQGFRPESDYERGVRAGNPLSEWYLP